MVRRHSRLLVVHDGDVLDLQVVVYKNVVDGQDRKTRWKSSQPRGRSQERARVAELLRQYSVNR